MNIIIVGAGAMGREVYSWLLDDIKNKKDYQIKGFLDEDPGALDNYNYPVKIIGTIADYVPQKNELIVIAAMDPHKKAQFAKTFMKKQARFYTLIHPTVILGQNVKIGTGCVICPNCILTTDIVIKDFVFINTCSTIGHDVVLGDYTSINGKVEITGKVKVGNKCMFGVGSKVIPNKIIGDNAIVGAGSVVIRNVKQNTTVFGNPAKIIER